MYVEHAPSPRVAGAVVCSWERDSGRGDPILVLPDGCVDVVWRSDGEVFVAGPDSGPVLHPHDPGLELAGLRLRPGTAASVLGVAADELRDGQTTLRDLWNGDADVLADRLGAAATRAERRELLTAAVGARLADAELDDAVLAATGFLTDRSTPVGALADSVGLAPRTFHRRFVLQIGYGPKFFERVLRFRRFLALCEQPHVRRHGLASLAAAAGYADQAHLARECRRLADRTPTELLAG